MIGKIKLFFLCMCVLWSTGSAAGTLNLTYEATGAGLHLMDAVATLTQKNTDYQMSTLTKTAGMLSMLVSAKTVFETTGQVRHTVWRPTQYVSRIPGKEGKDAKKRQVDFKPLSDMTDYQSAFITLMKTPPAIQVFKVNDGRRELLMAATFQGMVPADEAVSGLTASDMAYYTVSLTVVAGKKRGWFFNRMGDKENPPLHFYLMPAPETDGFVLVKASFDTALFGAITIRLKQWDFVP